ncbi:MAG TPA: hypothetical protein VGF67_30055 [Ktedonobacteraceae bacterium]|jgi:hypothetical protein
MEITNEGQAEKHRLQALVRLVDTLGEIEQSALFDLLQPQAPGETQEAQHSAARATLLVAKGCQLVNVDERRVVSGLLARAQCEQLSAFQALLSQRLLGVSEQGCSHYLFNLFSAWYAAQNERVLQELVETGYDGPLHTQVFPDATTRPFNSTRFAAWRKWAAFLGLGDANCWCPMPPEECGPCWPSFLESRRL